MTTHQASAASARKSKPIKHVEVAGSGYLLSKRLNPAKGLFPMFNERVKRKLGDTASMTAAEAAVQALKRATDLEHLQSVSLRDQRGNPNSPKDVQRAVETWLWYIDWDAASMTALMQRRNREANEASLGREILVDEVIELYARDRHAPGAHLTELGDAMLSAIDVGAPAKGFSAALEVWLAHTNRAHISPQSRTYQDAKRPLDSFVALVGDKALSGITRMDVARYINHRLQDGVRTATVDREITSLRTIWNRAANAADLQLRNPFADQPIRGLGVDSQRRPTPTLDSHQLLLKRLHAQDSGRVTDALLAVIALTGMRLAEAWGLLPEDWDSSTRILHIRPNELRRLKTSNSERPFPVEPELETWLGKLLSRQRSASTSSASALASKRLRELLPGFCTHALRHGFKQRLAETDTPEHVIRELMGWADQSMASHYGHLTVTEQKRGIVRKVYELLEPLPR